MSAAGPLVVEVPRVLAGAVAGIVLVAVVVVAVGWATRERPDDEVAKTAVVERERADRGRLVPHTRVLHPELGLGTIGLDPPLASGLFPVVFDRDHPRRVRWEPRILLDPVAPEDERRLADIERRGVEVFPGRRPSPAPQSDETPASQDEPEPCRPGDPCPWHNPADCAEAAPCCDRCPTYPRPSSEPREDHSA